MKPIQIQDWLASHNIELTFKERDDKNLPRYFTNVSKLIESTDGHFLTGIYGHGSTKMEALRDYALELSNKTIRIGGNQGYEVETPKLIVKNLKNLD